jgi:hypothetical protein
MEPRDTSDEAQRTLEQRALRNVRGLVDKMESIEHIDQRTQRRMLLWIAVGAVAAVFILGVLVWHASHRDSGVAVVIEPAKGPATRP